jgi:hypothetical protein
MATYSPFKEPDQNAVTQHASISAGHIPRVAGLANPSNATPGGMSSSFAQDAVRNARQDAQRFEQNNPIRRPERSRNPYSFGRPHQAPGTGQSMQQYREPFTPQQAPTESTMQYGAPETQNSWGGQQDLQQQTYAGPNHFQDPFGNNPYAMRPMQQPYTPTDVFGNDPYSNSGLNNPTASLDSSMRRVSDYRRQGMNQMSQPYQAPQAPVGNQSVQQLDGSTASLDDVLQKRRQLSQRGY